MSNRHKPGCRAAGQKRRIDSEEAVDEAVEEALDLYDLYEDTLEDLRVDALDNLDSIINDPTVTVTDSAYVGKYRIYSKVCSRVNDEHYKLLTP